MSRARGPRRVAGEVALPFEDDHEEAAGRLDVPGLMVGPAVSTEGSVLASAPVPVAVVAGVTEPVGVGGWARRPPAALPSGEQSCGGARPSAGRASGARR
ncbi:hypothetical protein, partial [Frankia sp. AgW1.1]|uniref:hypothetical protein n=1 Tax=Frankia sp. AgW1.1 TaxID=1836971 RepID=UPI001EE45B0E